MNASARGAVERDRQALRPITSKTVVVAVRQGEDCRKLIQVMFLRDGSLTVSFPYFHQSPCQLAIGTMPQAAFVPSLRMDKNLRASSHKVKYTHHVDGEAHFSQDGRIRTTVRRKAIPLTAAEGHLFTVSVQALSAFAPLSRAQRKAPTTKRATVCFKIGGKPVKCA